MGRNHRLMMPINCICLRLQFDGWNTVSDDNLMLWIVVLLPKDEAIFWLLDNGNGSRNGRDHWVWYDWFSDVGGSIIIEGWVFVTLIAIFKKKSCCISTTGRVNCMDCIVYVFPSTKLFLYLPVNCAEGEHIIWAIRGCFFFLFS